MKGLTYEEAAKILVARVMAKDNLVAFARYVKIPGIPETEDTNDSSYKLIETPLAAHHILVLNSLQAMVQGRLKYRRESLIADLQWPQLRDDQGMVEGSQWDHRTKGNTRTGIRESTSQTPHRGPLDGGVGREIDPAPSVNAAPSQNPPQNIPEKSGISQNEARLTLENMTDFPGKTLPENGQNPDFAGFRADPASECADPWVKCRRVLILAPPGSAKSTYATVVFPSWDIGRNPSSEIILTGWGDPICRRHGKRARQVCASEGYKAVFGTTLDPATTAAEDWALLNGSAYKSSGISSGVAGFRAGGLVWDDLTKSRKEADSPNIRNDVWNAYVDDARSRKTPLAWEVGIGTHWHEDDVMGRILPQGYAGESGFIRCRDGNVWFVICLAAQCERADDPLGREIGAYIWSDWFDPEYWGDKRSNARSWASLYMQRPAPDEGLFFKAEWIKTYTRIPEGCVFYVSYDAALSSEEDGGVDDTAIQVWAVDQQARLYLVAAWTKAVTMDVWIASLVDLVRRHRPIEVVSETGQIRKASEPYLKREMIQQRVFFAMQWVARTMDKSAMARSAQAMLSSGQVFLPQNSDGDELRDELLRFPTSKRDNRVDAFVNLCLRLEAIWAAAPVHREPEPVKIGASFPISKLMPPRDKPKISRWALAKKH